MAGNGQKKEMRSSRIVPGVEAGKTSRVSKAAGSLGSSSVRVEQRAAPSNPRSNSQRSSAKKGLRQLRQKVAVLPLVPPYPPIRASSARYAIAGTRYNRMNSSVFLASSC